jgi:selenide,water dikinase
VGPGDLKKLTEALPLERHPSLLVGMENSDDAGVVRLSEDTVLIQTLDFFTPIVDDPWTYGAIAAANALSDIYAMGGRPLTAMNIACFPIGKLSRETLSAILRGGYDKIKESGALLVGGHTVDDVELKYGLSVTGIARPGEIMTNSAARGGDRLFLTKPVGTGLISTAAKGGHADKASIKESVGWMLMLNDKSSAAAVRAGVMACTDVTGFGLLGHALEMARGSGVCLEIRADAVPLMSGAERSGADGYCPGGMLRNRKFAADRLDVERDAEGLLPVLFDPQTSGGLLIACPDNVAPALIKDFEAGGVRYWLIGSVAPKPAGRIRVLR